jgi:hypothetical protein
MLNRNVSKFLSCALLLIAGLPAWADEVISKEQVGADIATQNVVQDGPVLKGLVVNHSTHRIQDIQIGITYEWRWANEHHPGTDSPGWAGKLSVPEALEPGASREFTYTPVQSISDTALGTFHPSAVVNGYTSFEVPVQPVPSLTVK